MAKYILKESELREIISEAVREELQNPLNEGILHALWQLLKGGVKGAVAPGLLANDVVNTLSDLLRPGTNNATIGSTWRDFWGSK